MKKRNMTFLDICVFIMELQQCWNRKDNAIQCQTTTTQKRSRSQSLRSPWPEVKKGDSGSNHFEITKERNRILPTRFHCAVCISISFPEPTCLLVSAKTRSSGIIHFKSPRFWDFRFHGACVSWFKTWCLEIKSKWMRIECLCGTNPHQFCLWTPLLFQSSVSWRWPKDTWALGTRLSASMRMPSLRMLPESLVFWLWERDGTKVKNHEPC